MKDEKVEKERDEMMRVTAARGPEKVERGRRWGRRKLSVVTDGATTFTHTKRASVATIAFSDCMHQICGAYAKYMHIYNGL